MGSSRTSQALLHGGGSRIHSKTRETTKLGNGGRERLRSSGPWRPPRHLQGCEPQDSAPGLSWPPSKLTSPPPRATGVHARQAPATACLHFACAFGGALLHAVPQSGEPASVFQKATARGWNACRVPAWRLWLPPHTEMSRGPVATCTASQSESSRFTGMHRGPRRSTCACGHRQPFRHPAEPLLTEGAANGWGGRERQEQTW